MVDPYEKYVRWYLRFNGYFSIENFVIHEPVNGVVPQGGELDLLAVRFPWSREIAGFELENDERLIQSDVIKAGLIDFVFAEVGGGRRKKLNRIWEPNDPDGTKAERVAYALRWAGFLSDELEITLAANQLQSKFAYRTAHHNLRVIYFGQETQKTIENLGIKQITFREIAQFITNVRASCYAKRKIGVRSAHNQWDPHILKIWEIADPQSDLDPNQKVDSILKLLGDASKN